MAVRKRMTRRLVALVCSALALSVLPACESNRVFRRQALRPNPSVVPYSAYRPAYAPGPPKRTLFLGGYAGYNYSPSRVGGYVPTTHGVETWGYPEGHAAHDQGFMHR